MSQTIRLWLCDLATETRIKAGEESGVEGDHYITILAKSFEELTVSDYLRICEQGEEGERPDEFLARVFGIPTRVARVMKLHEANALASHYKNIWEAGKTDLWTKVKGLMEWANEAAKEDKFTREAIATKLAEFGMDRSTITVNGEVFSVPDRIEYTGTFGQWIELRTIAEKRSEDNAKRKEQDLEPLSEASLYPQALAIFCMREGEQFPALEDGEKRKDLNTRYAKWIEERGALFMQARFVDAAAVSAFFFSSSDEFASIMRPNMRSLGRLPRHTKEPPVMTMENAGEQGLN